ncbi:hypothetical protein HAX54_045157 [Datura stramonium]|uniref:Uncharacterized protein n=1 Tax=Datura stramonium TaxID=4076 RepID=A0ABS8SQA3_DATST|nr:hypothetical protein [Datura stramonium]
MAEAAQDEDEHTFPVKRKPQDIPAQEATAESHEDDANKKQKLSTTDSQDNKLDVAEEVEEEEEDEDDYEGEDEEEEDDDNDEQSNGEVEVDRKGKGILRDDKGKGKLIEDSDDDDSSDFGSESDVDTDSDLSDDLLAEVDLGNIIPSRTRRRTHHSGLKISDDPVEGDKRDGSDA